MAVPRRNGQGERRVIVEGWIATGQVIDIEVRLVERQLASADSVTCARICEHCEPSRAVVSAREASKETTRNDSSSKSSKNLRSNPGEEKKKTRSRYAEIATAYPFIVLKTVLIPSAFPSVNGGDVIFPVE